MNAAPMDDAHEGLAFEKTVNLGKPAPTETLISLKQNIH